MVTADDFERRTRGRARTEKGARKGGLGGWLLGGVILAAGGGVAATNEDVRDAVLGFSSNPPVTGEARTAAPVSDIDSGVRQRMEAQMQLRAHVRRVIEERQEALIGGRTHLNAYELEHITFARRATADEVASGVPANIINYAYHSEGAAEDTTSWLQDPYYQAQ
jgi:hypothetical protein